MKEVTGDILEVLDRTLTIEFKYHDIILVLKEWGTSFQDGSKEVLVEIFTSGKNEEVTQKDISLLLFERVLKVI